MAVPEVLEETKRRMLAQITCRPYDIDGSVFYFPNLTAVSPSPLLPRDTYRGKLDILVSELITEIFVHADFGTLAALRLTCFNLKSQVDSLAIYTRVTTQAATVLKALQVSSLIQCHSAIKIYNGLLSSVCALCGQFGPYFSVFTGERCCYYCVLTHLSLRLITLESAKGVFGISPHLNPTSLRLQIMELPSGYLRFSSKVHLQQLENTACEMAAGLRSRAREMRWR